MKYYAGIGSRQTIEPILLMMVDIGRQMAEKNYILRSGAADGADSAFEKGCDSVGGKKEIFLPWRGFNNHGTGIYEIPDLAFTIAESFHPAWNKCSAAVRKLHSRNVMQILGGDLQTPVEAVICWTRNASGQGGTGQAIRIARAHGIPVMDMGGEAGIKAVQVFISNDLI